MRISKNIDRKALKLGLEASSKDEALAELVSLLCGAYRLNGRDAILDAIRAREEKQSTGIGMGLAVPHAKTPAVDRLYIAFGRSVEGIEFDSIDGGRAHLFFMLVSPRDVSGPHIRALAGISRLIKHEEFRKELLECSNAKRWIDIVKQAEARYL